MAIAKHATLVTINPDNPSKEVSKNVWNADHIVTLGADENYVTDAQLVVIGNTSGTNTGDQDLSGLVTKATYDAQTILHATTDDTPIALTVTEQTVVGRATGGNITALSIDSDLSSVSANDDTIPSAKATKAMGDLKLPLAGGTMSGNIDFATYKAIAMACDNGTTVPTSPAPVAGQWFLHTPTGRKVLMQHDGSAWIPIMNIGATTLYVDSTDGTDAVDKGGAVDAGAFKTIQYAVDSIAGTYSGNIIIYINNESYAEAVVIRGKARTGNYTFTLQGTLNVAKAAAAQTSSVQGATTTMGSISDTGNLGSYDNMLLYSSNNAEYRVIDSDTVNTATIVGYWTAAPSGNYTIYNWGTTITGAIALTVEGILGFNVNDVSLVTSSTFSAWCAFNTEVTFTRCKSTGAMLIRGSVGVLSQCYLDGTGKDAALMPQAFSKVSSTRNKYYKAVTGVIRVSYLSSMTFAGANVIDGGSVAGVIGVDVYRSSTLSFENTYTVVKNGALYGVYAQQGGQIAGTVNNQYSGNGTNEVATAASYGYVD